MAGLVNIPDSFNVTMRLDNFTLFTLAIIGAGLIVMARIK